MNDDILHLWLLDDEAIILDSSALDIARLDHPGIDLARHVEVLEAIAERLDDLGHDARSNGERAWLLSQVLAAEFGFTGDRATYDDPANADLIEVIERRCGLPVSLAILHVAAARRVGWSADALNVPGHVMVRVGTGADQVLIDPFRDGAIVEPAQLAGLAGSAALAEQIAPLPNRGVLVRLLMNQATRAEAAGDAARALVLFERITIIAPAHGHGWWERARLELARGEVASARASLSAMLEMTRDPAMRARINAILHRLARAER